MNVALPGWVQAVGAGVAWLVLVGLIVLVGIAIARDSWSGR